MSVRLVALAAALLVPSAAAAEQWNKVQSDHFTVVGDVSHGRLGSVARTLEQFRLATSLVFPTRAVSAPRPLTVIVAGRNTMRSFVGTDFIAGLYRRGGDHDYIIMSDDMSGDEAMQVALHEYQHLINHATWPSLPRWVDEGLAEFYSTFDELNGGKQYYIGLPIREHVRALNNWGRERITDFIAQDGRTGTGFNGIFQITDFYAQSWALVHFFALGDNGRWSGAFGPLVEALANGEAGGDAFRRIVTADVEEFEARFKRYLQNQSFQYVSLGNESGSEFATVRGLLSVAETETLKGTLIENLDRAGASLAAARAADPAYRPAIAQEARHRLWSRDARAEATLTAYAKESPDDHYTCGMAMFALNAAGRFDQALATCAATSTQVGIVFERIVALDALGRAAEAGPQRARLLTAPTRDISELRWRAWRYLEAGGYAAARRAADAVAPRDNSTPDVIAYLRFVSTLSQILGGDAEAGRAELRRTPIPAGSGAWVKTVQQHLLGEIDATTLVSRARGREEQTEAHAYAGLVMLATGDAREATQHLKWVTDRGSDAVTEYHVAVAHYRRLTAPPASR